MGALYARVLEDRLAERQPLWTVMIHGCNVWEREQILTTGGEVGGLTIVQYTLPLEQSDASARSVALVAKRARLSL